MDRADRLINNHALQRILFYGILLLIFSAGAAWCISGTLADVIVSKGIRSVLKYETFLNSEVLLSEYGFHSDMMTSLIPEYQEIRTLLFWTMTGCAALICLILCCAALYEVNRIYTQLEALRIDCMALAEQTKHTVSLQGEDFGCVRRICDGINLVAKRMQYYSESFRKEKYLMKDFLTDFSHQIKNHLAGIRLNSDMLAELEHLPAVQRQRLSEELFLQLDEMEKLVMTSLKLARLNADAVLYEKEFVSLTETCQFAVQRLMPLLRRNHITVRFTPEAPVLFLHDRVWMGEVVQNLLMNAICHAECSEIQIELASIPGAVKMCIIDNGSGIPQSEIPKLFERFGRKRSGTGMQSVGIGLGIARKIIEAHDGAITVYSDIGEGTRFEIILLRSVQDSQKCT